MYFLIILLPFISFFLLITLGRFIGKQGSIYISLICLLISLLFSIIVLYEVGFLGYVCTLKITSWIDIGILNLQWGLFFDSLTVIMIFVVIFISFLVHLYSTSYMENDPHIIRFMSFLSLFTFFMLILISSDNFVQLFFGWEGVGLCSYLLVNFWYTREQANKSAMKAIIVNRIGDFFLFLGLLSIFLVFKTFDFIIINSLVLDFEFLSLNFFSFNLRVLDLMTFFFFAAAVGKSAQVSLHTWLPDAMEGPTPVSALIHAATMVTAGIFLILRCSFLFECSEEVLNLITFFGTITAILASTSGIFQYDIKKVIAYSTASQLGYMFLACGTSNYSVAIFHLFNHAFFKALLFLGAGSVIHALNDEQDMRKMGGIFKLIPYTFTSMLLGTLALIGIPFLTGFYSKDLIIETLIYKYNWNFFFGCSLACLVTFFTAFYSFRLLILTFFLDFKGAKKIFFKVHECSILMLLPLMILSFFTLFIGYITKDIFVGMVSCFWQQTFILPIDFLNSTEFLDVKMKLIPFFGTILGIFFSIILYRKFYLNYVNVFCFFLYKYNYCLKDFFFFFGKKWLFDYLYNRYISKFILFLGYNVIFKTIDRGLIEFFGPLGFVHSFFSISNQISKIQTGYIYHYFLFKFVGFFLLGFLYNNVGFFFFTYKFPIFYTFVDLFFSFVIYIIKKKYV